MAAYIFRLPDIGEGIAEAEIVAWHVKVGDRLDAHQALVDVMTDKATVEMTSPVAGIVTAIHGEAGQLLPVGGPLVELEVVELDASDGAPADNTPLPASPIAPTKAFAPLTPGKPAPGNRSLASPATRRRAQELGIALQQVPGTGPGGRITAEDLDRLAASGAAAPRDGITEIKIIGLRRRIAEKMQDAARIPHFSYIEEFDLTELEALRKKLNTDRMAEQPKLTLLPFLMRAIVQLVPAFPRINARYDDTAGILHAYASVHIGIATQTPGGLVVPVVRHAETLDLWGCARELARVTSAARDGKVAEKLTGSTITLTSLGAMGGIASTPMLNAPEVAIIGPNKRVDRPVARNGEMMIRSMMNVSSSFDHRIIDGYDAARFIQELKRVIEQPALLFPDLSAGA
jgi:2-oxoisovalerate dehydrogenase E2 component (dihydrolipoyl transacylase)